MLDSVIVVASFLLFLSMAIYFFLFPRTRYLDAEGKVVLVTGCDSGIGLQVAQFLYSQGLTVIACCLSIKSEGAQLLIKSDKFKSERMFVTKLDVTEKASIEQCCLFIRNVLNETGNKGIWALINNAGVCVSGEFDWLTHDQIQQQIDVNLLGSIYMCKAVLPFIKKVRGRVINVGSVNGTCAYPGFSVYCATKYAIEGFSDAIRYELGKLGVKTVLVRPGDFARLTRIMCHHELHMKQMWQQMSEEDKCLYGEYFKDYEVHVSQNYGLTSPASFENSQLFAHFKSAVLAHNPKYSYTISPLSMKIFFNLLSTLPAKWKDNLIHFICLQTSNFDARKYFTPTPPEKHGPHPPLET